MNSYRMRKQEIAELKEQLRNAKEYERMMKNYIRAIANNNQVDKESIEKWFIKNSQRYSSEVKGFLNK